MILASAPPEMYLSALRRAEDAVLRHGITERDVEALGEEQLHRLGADAALVLRNAAAAKKAKPALEFNPFERLLKNRTNVLKQVSQRDLKVTHPAACRRRAQEIVSRRYGADRVVGAAFHRLPKQAKQRIRDDIETEFDRIMEIKFSWSAHATDLMRESRRACMELITDGETQKKVVKAVRKAEEDAVAAVYKPERRKRIRDAETAWGALNQVRQAIERAREDGITRNMPTYEHLKTDDIKKMIEVIHEHPDPDNFTKDTSWLPHFAKELETYRTKLLEPQTDAPRLLRAKWRSKPSEGQSEEASNEENEDLGEQAKSERQAIMQAGEAILNKPENKELQERFHQEIDTFKAKLGTASDRTKDKIEKKEEEKLERETEKLDAAENEIIRAVIQNSIDITADDSERTRKQLKKCRTYTE